MMNGNAKLELIDGSVHFKGRVINDFQGFICGIGSENKPFTMQIYGNDLHIDELGECVDVDTDTMKFIKENGKVN